MEQRNEMIEKLEKRLLIVEQERKFWINKVVENGVGEENTKANEMYHRACGKVKLLNDMINEESGLTYERLLANKHNSY